MIEHLTSNQKLSNPSWSRFFFLDLCLFIPMTLLHVQDVYTTYFTNTPPSSIILFQSKITLNFTLHSWFVTAQHYLHAFCVGGAFCIYYKMPHPHNVHEAKLLCESSKENKIIWKTSHVFAYYLKLSRGLSNPKYNSNIITIISRFSSACSIAIFSLFIHFVQ